jgi:hypothetical protein
MKVLDLQCPQQHAFEGWFGSEEDYQSQLQRGLVECPLCGDANITKMLSAPRINLGKTRDADSKPPQSSSQAVSGPSSQPGEVATASAKPLPEQRPPASTEAAAVMQAAWMEVARHVMANTEDVGSSFAAEARKIHYGEADERAIRGQATQDQTMELIEEGIDVMPLPIPESLKRPLN